MDSSEPPAHALLRHCRNGFLRAAKLCGVPHCTLRAHALELSRPSEPARLAYERAFGIPASSWPQARRGRPSKALDAALAELDSKQLP